MKSSFESKEKQISVKGRITRNSSVIESRDSAADGLRLQMLRKGFPLKKSGGNTSIRAEQNKIKLILGQ